MRLLLIANRGEIAIRIARTARRMGIRTVAVFSDADRDAPHVRACDFAVAIGGEAPADSYLRIDRLIDAARRAGADAVHPGYGFLSENAAFARACGDSGLTFVGPPPAAIEAMADKAAARRRVAAAGIPVLAGYDGDDQSVATLAAEARRIGFPVMIKAASGGGGRGMRLVRDDALFPEAARSAATEAEKAFGDGRLLLERAVDRARHIEIQVFGDRHGNLVHLGDRDCSIQRRHQKLIEEAPAPGLAADLREALACAALRAAQTVDYVGAGTVEFLLDAESRFTFMEMNTRLQVEHPVTEAIAGLDLVEWQIRVARGEPLPLRQSEIRFAGHAIEARLVAEDAAGFLPRTGIVRDVAIPEGVRVDHAIGAGVAVSPHYDSLLGKIVAHGATRDEARRRLVHALDRLVVLGVPTNRAFLGRALRDETFAAGAATTAFIAERFADAASRAPAAPPEMVALAFAIFAGGAGLETPMTGLPSGWSNGGSLERPMRLLVDGNECAGRVETRREPGKAPAHVVRFGASRLTVEFGASPVTCQDSRATVDGRPLPFRFVRAADPPQIWLAAGDDHHAVDVTLVARTGANAVAATASGEIVSPMQAKVAAILVGPGASVARGDVVATLEAMKLEHALRATTAGRVTAIHAAVGQSVRPGAPILTIAPADDPA